MPIKILIVEDEMIIAANISLQLTTLGYDVTGIIPRGEEVLANVQGNPPDIILLDINLKGELDGVQIAQLLQKQNDIPIIYLTANSDEANFNRAKATHPHAFLSKPFKKLDLQRAIELTVERLSETQPEKLAVPEQSILHDAIFIRHHDKMVKVSLPQILYIEAERNYCRIVTAGKESVIVMTLKEMDDKLPNDFMRIHRSFIVNLSHLDEIASSHVVIGKKAIPISTDLRKQLLDRIQKI